MPVIYAISIIVLVAVTYASAPTPPLMIAYCLILTTAVCVLMRRFRSAVYFSRSSLLFSVMIVVVNSFVNPQYRSDPDHDVFYFSNEGFSFALSTASNLTVFLAVFTVGLLTDRNRLLRLLIRLRTPSWMLVFIFQSICTIELIKRRAVAVAEAQQSRGVRMTGNVWNRIRGYHALAVPTVVATIVESEERASALMSRGFGKNTIRPPELSPTSTESHLAIIIAVVITIMFIVYEK